MPIPVANRLPVDAHVIGYYGFDEANETDDAIDEGVGGNNLTFFNAVSVASSRQGNGRQFDGLSTYATPAASADLRLGDLTIITWVTLDSVLPIGSHRRTVVACDGPTAGLSDRTLYYLGVRDDGAIVFEHETPAGDVVLWETAPGVLRTTRFYSLALVRHLHGADCDVSLWLNNELMPWAAISLAGVPGVDPLHAPNPPAAGLGSTQTFKVGVSDRYPDAFWHGIIDELSLHDTFRAYDPYLRAAYFRLTLAQAWSKLTTNGTIKTVGSVEMGGGSRWWCYERDGSLFVVRENTLGLFSPEIQLTTGGTMWNGAPFPSGTIQPRLAYDSVTDTLLVAFLAAGRVYKITASAGDDASTQNMPYTADTAGIIKVRDAIDLHRVSAGEGEAEPEALGMRPNGDGTSAATVSFIDTPSFGMAIETPNAYGYVVERILGGWSMPIGTVLVPQTARFETYQLYFFFPIGSRVQGATYRARMLTSSGHPGAVPSLPLRDELGLISDWDTSIPGQLIFSRDGDFPQEHHRPSAGERASSGADLYVRIQHTPIKIPLVDSFTPSAGQACIRNDEFRVASAAPVKVSILEVFTPSAGSSTRFTARRSGGAGVVFDL